MNGDGFADVIVGAPTYDAGQADEGRAYVYYGSASGLQTAAAWTAESNQASASLGLAVGTAGDVNGDGFADVIVGAPDYDADQEDQGQAFVYHGSSSGLVPGPADWTATGAHRDAFLGSAVSTAGDVNGDGYADVLIGEPWYAWDFGRVSVYHGSSMGLTTGNADWTAEGDDDEGRFGSAVSTAGDVNGDGYADVIIGERHYNEGRGRAHVYYGSSTGLSTGSPDWTEVGSHARDYFGRSVGTAGDVNGDGYADVIVGALDHDYEGNDGPGRAYVYLGSATGLEIGPADRTVGHYQARDDLGYSVSTAGDVNGDGYADVIVGAPRHDGGQTDEGRAYVYLGSASSLSVTANWVAESDNVGGQFGYALGPAGDVNGDGYADVVIGALRYDGGQAEEGAAFAFYGSAHGLSRTPDWMAESNQAYSAYGHSASTAGDVNGDGYDDVLIGASFYDAGQQDEGRAFVFFGSPAGLSPTPNWTAEGDSVEAHYGGWANTAGDVNGDGYADIVVGAQWYTGGEHQEGKAYVYHGSPSGPSATADWATEGNQVGARYGRSVSTAGDVNGDGYADVIVSAFVYDSGQTDEGKVWVFHGSPSGLSTTANWTAESNQTSSRFGRTVSSAGDVNGDGYADVIIGAYWYKNGQDNEGRVYVYHGSPSGLRRTPAWTVESNQEDAELGRASNTAGDVNGDGYADVIVGAYRYDVAGQDEGKVWLYHGSAAGLSTTPAWTAEGDQADALFGHSASTAGDVNGDGYADVIVSADWYDAGQENEGRVYLYYGNGGRGMDLRPRQRRSDGSAPIAHLGQAPDNALRLAALGRTPFGRGKVKLEWEAKPLGVPLDGSDIQQAGSWADTGVVGAELEQLVSGLQANTPYHWRVRLRYHPASSPFAQSSRWLTVPWNGWQEQDLRTGSISSLPTVEFDSAAYSVAEGAGSATARVHLSSASTQRVTVEYATSDGTASTGQDYVARSGTLVFNPGVTSRSLTISLIDDVVDEPDETVLLSLSNPTRALLGAISQSTLTMQDDDEPPRVDFSAATYSVSEGMRSVTLQVDLSAASSRQVTVGYATSDGTAAAGSDYQAISGTLTFDPGVTRRAFNVPLLADLLDERDETVVLTLSHAVNATLASVNNPATLTIVDDDDPPVVRFERANYVASEAAGAATISVMLDAPSTQIVTVDYATSDGTARAPGDYGATGGTLTFAPGDTRRSFEVSVVDDGVAEENETILLRLSNASHAALGGANPATLTLQDGLLRAYLPLIMH